MTPDLLRPYNRLFPRKSRCLTLLCSCAIFDNSKTTEPISIKLGHLCMTLIDFLGDQ